MVDPIDELAADIDDASTAVEELQVDHEPTPTKSWTTSTTLEHASDMIDEIADKDEKE